MQKLLGLIMKGSVLFGVALLIGCAGRVNPGLERQCAVGLKNGFHELDLAKARGFSGTVDWGKAAALLTAAKTQQQFEKYPNCVEKVKKARYYINRSQRKL